jgi:hypothetical protein
MVRDRVTVRGWAPIPTPLENYFHCANRGDCGVQEMCEDRRTSSLAGMCRERVQLLLVPSSWDLEKSRVTLWTEAFSLGVQYIATSTVIHRPESVEVTTR